MLLLQLLQLLRLIALCCGAAAEEGDAAGYRPITELTTTPRAAHGLAAQTTETPSVTVI